MHISQISKTNFIMVDEGFDNLDDDNKIGLEYIFMVFQEHYKYVILISHNTELKSLVDGEIGISITKDGYSHIEYH